MWTDLVVQSLIVFHLAGSSVFAEDNDTVTKLEPAVGKGRQPVVKAKELDWETLEVAVPPRRVFKFSFNANMFSWSEGNLGGLERHEYKYTPALRDSAGLPAWMKYRYSARHKAGFLYGVPPVPGQGLNSVEQILALTSHDFCLRSRNKRNALKWILYA